MPNEPKTTDKPNIFALFQEMLEDHLGKKEFTEAFGKVIEYVKDFETKTGKAIVDLATALTEKADSLRTDIITLFEGQQAETTQRVNSALDSFATQVTQKLREVDQAVASIENGKDADEDAIADRVKSEVIAPITEEVTKNLPSSGPAIRDALELLSGEDRLSVKALDGLDEIIARLRRDFPRMSPQGAVHGPLYGLTDVDVVGITVGQSIKWTGTRWIPFTPTGANTSVYGVIPTGSGVTFTLANTPVAGTLRLYRGGAYQIAGAGEDYTLSGATITLSVTLATGEKLAADYEY